MSGCCSKKTEPPEPPDTPTGCCGPSSTSTNGGDDQCGSGKPDYLLRVSGSVVLLGYLIHLFAGGVFGDAHLPQWLRVMSSGMFELMNQMWLGLLAAIAFVGVLDRVPRQLVMSALGRGGSVSGIARATLAGVMLDLCSHGILMVGAKLYERGASLGQLMAFLIASPWNSLSLTIILASLIGVGWTLLFIALSMAIGMITGMTFDGLVSRGILPANPNVASPDMASPDMANPNVESPNATGSSDSSSSIPMFVSELSFVSECKAWIKQLQFSPQGTWQLIKDGARDSKMVFRWLFFGLVLATAIRAFVPGESYQALFGPTVVGLLLTLLAATVIEVCSEGATPIAADIVTRVAAPGNGFAFLMAGVATDYTEVMVLKEVTKSWKIALFLPLLCLPQVVLMGWVLNQFG